MPVNVYAPGDTTPTAVPDDYLEYLLSQDEHGATFEDVVETTIDGLPATIMTVTTRPASTAPSAARKRDVRRRLLRPAARPDHTPA